MISIDTNILLYAQNMDCREHSAAYEFVLEYSRRKDVVLCELVLVELYVLHRNPFVLERPLSSSQAVETCQTYRQNSKWRLVENAPVMESVWNRIDKPRFPRRRIFDIRLALTLQQHEVTDLATANTKDFQGLGFHRVWNPITDIPS
ncbi:MAG: TA system VapC family ribonuclease toxin [Pseudomonadota bacterium]|nr:TA system VapC family ribonuclease toxin [Pseudomonadota bacterium]